MEDSTTDPTARPPATTSGSNSSSALPPAAAVRYRIPQRLNNSKEGSPSPRRPATSPLARRRSSLISYSSFEDIRQAFTDDIVDPKTTRVNNQTNEEEVTHWHSTPLAFAILPALGGLFFRDGKAFTSDILLLGLAAVFLNWSIRLPWDWYYSAQALRSEVTPAPSPDSDRVSEETAIETASSVGDSPELTPRNIRSSEVKEHVEHDDRRAEAAAGLRKQETLALIATFTFPVAAAYLLHLIRAQLSTSSTGLVSDYNLSIFLLAAEIRPCRQVVRLVANRTLHLQKTVAGADDPLSSIVGGRDAIDNLTNRIAELEHRLGDDTVTPASATVAQKTDVSDLAVELRKRYEPRLEGLERAVRRYEKRSTTLAISTEQRLQSLEHRIQEALSLAAVAAQHSRDRGAVPKLIDTVSALIVWPIRTAWNICMSPVLLLEDLYAKLKALLVGASSHRRSARRKNAKLDGSSVNEKTHDKAVLRRAGK